MASYDIDFKRLIWLEIHIRAFGDTTILSCPYLIQQLCDATEVPHLLRLIIVLNLTNQVLAKRDAISYCYFGPFLGTVHSV